MKYDRMFRSFLGDDWKQISDQPVTHENAKAGLIATITGGAHTHRTGHPWHLIGLQKGPVSGTGAGDLQRLLDKHNANRNPRRRAV
jgi:hypothetical protein